MDQAVYLTVLDSEGTALADAAGGHFDRPVPSCPEWDVGGLVAHLGGVYRWARKVVEAGGDRVGPRELAEAPGDESARIEWFRAGLADLVTALSVDPDSPAWTFPASAPDTVGWWRRRQALETALHRWDTQTAATGRADPIGTELAVDGVDELLSDFLPRAISSHPDAALKGTLHLHATDTPGEWWLDLDAEGLAARREHAKADTAVRGPASGLYLWLWNRQTPEAAGLEVFGRTETVQAWPAVKV